MSPLSCTGAAGGAAAVLHPAHLGGACADVADVSYAPVRTERLAPSGDPPLCMLTTCILRTLRQRKVQQRQIPHVYEGLGIKQLMSNDLASFSAITAIVHASAAACTYIHCSLSALRLTYHTM